VVGAHFSAEDGDVGPLVSSPFLRRGIEEWLPSGKGCFEV